MSKMQELLRRHRMANPTPAPSVAADAEALRVAMLPRRQLADLQALSKAFRKRELDDAGEPVLLRQAQADALHELKALGGLFAPMRVGSGKSLVTLLAATVTDAQRPVLIIPASLKTKTKVEFSAYFKNWRVRLPRLVSYEELGRPDRDQLLNDLAPDLLIMDEAHRVRNKDSAMARRIRRCIMEHKPKVLALSGTLMTDKIMEYHHFAVWCLGLNAPMPIRPSDAERWSLAVDKDVGLLQRRAAPGALAELPGGFHEHFRGSRGVIPTPGSDCTASIQITTWSPPMPKELSDVIDMAAMTGLRPDDEPLDEWDLPDCLCQLALGFYYRWDPMPPDWWLLPRRAWRAYASAVLEEHIDGFDSESQIVSALDNNGQAPSAPEGRYLLNAWRSVREDFTPNPVPVWLSDEPIKQIIKRAENALIWTKYRAVGAKFEALGVPYFGAGTAPETTSAGKTIALSIAAHGTGRNLQGWANNIVTVPMANADAWEQLIGRTHRAGQKKDTVLVDILDTIEYHGEVLNRVHAEARRISKASGFPHKLVDADWIRKGK